MGFETVVRHVGVSVFVLALSYLVDIHHSGIQSIPEPKEKVFFMQWTGIWDSRPQWFFHFQRLLLDLLNHLLMFVQRLQTGE